MSPVAGHDSELETLKETNSGLEFGKHESYGASRSKLPQFECHYFDLLMNCAPES